MTTAHGRRAALWLLAMLIGVVTSCTFNRESAAAPAGVRIGSTIDLCTAAAVDRDLDGIDDTCELELARAFAPLLVVDRDDCSWSGIRLAGGYFFAVQRGSTRDAVRIAYLPAYFRDCGWTGIACAARGPSCSAHPGDSELIAVDARSIDGHRWRLEALFLSAHCLGRSAGRCRWYVGDELAYFTWTDVTRGAPRVWVAKGKHANYPSARECDSGHWYYDSCDGHDAGYTFPILSSQQNIGSRLHPLPDGAAGCVTADRLPLPDHRGDNGTTECFWDDVKRFTGWQRTNSRGATSYARVLADVGF